MTVPIRTPIPLTMSPFTVLTPEQLAIYLVGQGAEVVELRGRLWRNAAAPSPIRRFDWTPVERWQPLPAQEAGFPKSTAMAYRCLASTQVPTRFPFIVFRDVQGYDHMRIRNRSRNRCVRRALDRYELHVLTGPELLERQGWRVASAAARMSHMQLPTDEQAYRRDVTRMFSAVPPKVVAATRDGRLAGYLITYATGSEAMAEKIYVDPQERSGLVGYALYWAMLTGWHKTTARNLWTGGVLGTGVDDFKTGMGAQVERVPVHAGMRRAVRWAARVLKPDAVSLAALNG